MNPIRLLLAILAAFVTILVTSILIHGVWMLPVYKATMHLWRTDPEMAQHRPWMMSGQLLAAVAFVLIWARGFAQIPHFRCAITYGLVMGLFSQSQSLTMFAVQPLTQEIVWKWFIGGVLQGIVVGIVVFFVYGRAPAADATLNQTMHP